MPARSRPPLELAVELTAPDGRIHQLNLATADDRPQGLQLTSKRYEGFSTAGCVLPRQADRDWPDLNLYDGYTVAGANGDVAWDGRIAQLPRSIDQSGHSITVNAVGHVAALRDQPGREIYVDRDLSGWGQVGTSRRAQLITALYNVFDPSTSPDSSHPAVVTSLSGPWDRKSISESFYDAGSGLRIAQVYYEFLAGDRIDPADPLWRFFVGLAIDDQEITSHYTANLSARSGSGTHTSGGGSYRFATLWHDYQAAGGLDGVNYDVQWRNLAVYGDHGAPLTGPAPQGITASDVIRHFVGKYAPSVVAGEFVTPTTDPIAHLVFRDPTDPYDAILEANKFHLFEFGVWEDRQLHWGPADLTDYDWEIRTDDPGVTISPLQGDSAEDLANGVIVSYQDVLTGRTEYLHPDDHSELRDDDVEHPANRHGLPVYKAFQVSSPTDQGGALQLGRAALDQFNRAKAPGTITATDHIRDRAGNWQPVWKVRANDTIAITSSTAYSDRPRLIGEASYNHDQRQVTIAVDATMQTLDAIQDRIATALKAANLAG